MNIFEKSLHRLDTYQRRHPKAAFLHGVIKKYGEDEAGHRAALMAYYGFLSLFPLLLILTTIVRITFREDSSLHRQIVDGAVAYFPSLGGELTRNIHSLGGNGVALVLGLLVVLYGARGVADVFRSTVNHIWEVPYARRPGFPWTLLSSLRIIVVGGIGLILAPIISGYAASAGYGPVFWLASLAVTLLMLFGIFIYLLFVSLHGRRHWRELWPSALMAAAGLQILQSVGGLLVTHKLKLLDDLYGTFAVVLGLLFWLYLQAQVIVYALEAGTVKHFRLYPRSIMPGRPTSADKKAFHMYTERNRFHDDTDDAPKHASAG